MEKQNDLYKNLLDHLQEGVYFTDTSRIVQYWNEGSERLTGYSADEVVGRSCSHNILVHVDDNGVCLCKSGCPLAATIRDGVKRQAKVYLHHKDGHRVPVNVFASQIRNGSGEVIGAVETFYDASSTMAAFEEIEKLREQSLLCPLTSVGNRRHAEQVLRKELDVMAREHSPLTVVFVDIDHFKAFNDTHGHEVGDQVLKVVARTMAGAMRSYDFLGRWGGEEFVAILPRLRSIEVAAMAERLRTLVELSSFENDGASLRPTVSIGAYTCQDGDTPERAVREADRLMYESKNGGRNRVTVG